MKKKTCDLCHRPWGEHTIARIRNAMEWICPPPKA